jgi:ectoine hydroxylase-related dioxygenase (phytanoyl-CoA dioxygenase family)
VTLDADAIANYQRDGFVCVGKMFTPAEIAAMNDAVDEFVDRARHLSSSDEIFDLGPDHQPGRVQLRRIRDPERHHPAFAEAYRNVRLLDELASLLGPDIRAIAGKLNIKEPGASTVVEWHQDWAYGPRTNDDALTVGIALGSMDRQSGCLEVIPGSHTGPVLDHERAGTFTGTVTEPNFVPNGAVPIELEAGDVSIHHIRALHGSAPNRSSRQRRLLLYSYAAADAWPLEGVRDPTSFDSMMLRGSAPRAPRLERVPVRPMPRWDELDGSSLFELQESYGRGFYRSRSDDGDESADPGLPPDRSG